MRFAVDGHLRFVHGFEKSGLRARGGAVDFVGQHNVGENRAGAEFKFARVGMIDADAQDVTGQQVGSELHALEGAVEGFRERLGQGGFADAGNIFDQQVAAGKKRDQGELNDVFLAENGAGDGALQLRDDVRGGGRHRLKTPVNPVTKENALRFCLMRFTAHRFQDNDSRNSAPVPNGRLAQRLERSPHTREVKGSNPLSPTTLSHTDI